MTWIRQTDPRRAHTCSPPQSEPPFGRPHGAYGDLWRCDDCRTLWRIGHACQVCDRYGEALPHRGGHAVGNAWHPATLWQRLANKKRTS